MLWQYYRITGDRAWLKKAYPQMLKAVDWIKRSRRQVPAASPFAGLLPAAPADGEFLWDGKHHIVGYDLWNLRGLLCTLRGPGSCTPGVERPAAEYAAYHQDFDAACRRTGLACPAQLGKRRHPLGQHRDAVAGARAAAG